MTKMQRMRTKIRRGENVSEFVLGTFIKEHLSEGICEGFDPIVIGRIANDIIGEGVSDSDDIKELAIIMESVTSNAIKENSLMLKDSDSEVMKAMDKNPDGISDMVKDMVENTAKRTTTAKALANKISRKLKQELEKADTEQEEEEDRLASLYGDNHDDGGDDDDMPLPENTEDDSEIFDDEGDDDLPTDTPDEDEEGTVSENVKVMSMPRKMLDKMYYQILDKMPKYKNKKIKKTIRDLHNLGLKTEKAKFEPVVNNMKLFNLEADVTDNMDKTLDDKSPLSKKAGAVMTSAQAVGGNCPALCGYIMAYGIVHKAMENPSDGIEEKISNSNIVNKTLNVSIVDIKVIISNAKNNTKKISEEVETMEEDVKLARVPSDTYDKIENSYTKAEMEDTNRIDPAVSADRIMKRSNLTYGIILVVKSLGLTDRPVEEILASKG